MNVINFNEKVIEKLTDEINTIFNSIGTTFKIHETIYELCEYIDEFIEFIKSGELLIPDYENDGDMIKCDDPQDKVNEVNQTLKETQKILEFLNGENQDYPERKFSVYDHSDLKKVTPPNVREGKAYKLTIRESIINDIYNLAKCVEHYLEFIQTKKLIVTDLKKDLVLKGSTKNKVNELIRIRSIGFKLLDYLDDNHNIFDIKNEDED